MTIRMSWIGSPRTHLSLLVLDAEDPPEDPSPEPEPVPAPIAPASPDLEEEFEEPEPELEPVLKPLESDKHKEEPIEIDSDTKSM